MSRKVMSAETRTSVTRLHSAAGWEPATSVSLPTLRGPDIHRGRKTGKDGHSKPTPSISLGLLAWLRSNAFRSNRRPHPDRLFSQVREAALIRTQRVHANNASLRATHGQVCRCSALTKPAARHGDAHSVVGSCAPGFRHAGVYRPRVRRDVLARNVGTVGRRRICLLCVQHERPTNRRHDVRGADRCAAPQRRTSGCR